MILSTGWLSWTTIVYAFRLLLDNPQVAELFRFLFLGTVLEAGKQVAQRIGVALKSAVLSQATFQKGDFAFDWVIHYLDHLKTWENSRSFRVVARNPTTHGRFYRRAEEKVSTDGHPVPLYTPEAEATAFVRWRGYWISVDRSKAGHQDHDTGEEFALSLTLGVYGFSRRVLEDFVQEARRFYIERAPLPRKVDASDDLSESCIAVTFEQNDFSYQWILAFVQSTEALRNVTMFTVSTKQSDAAWTDGPKDAIKYMPASASKQLFKWRDYWLQVLHHPGDENWEGRVQGAYITLTLYCSKKDVIDELIEEARQLYMAGSLGKVTVHLADNHGSWAKVVVKSRRALSTLILPAGIKETILADATEFLDNEAWYRSVGVPYRRGYLLYGEPGTGKSSTIHALAGELGLEVYHLSLAAPGVDDYTLGKLVSDTPSRCLLLLEDIDCAFPSREPDDVPQYDEKGKVREPGTVPPRSEVTLAGLLNVLDSVSSEEGRLTFATTNHIDQLDPALIRDGRMDVKVQYKLATAGQIEDVFKRFYPLSVSSSWTDATVEACARAFAAAVPEAVFSVAQLQGYLLTKKQNPEEALAGVGDWIARQEEEKRELEEIRRKRRKEAMLRRKEAEDRTCSDDDASE